MLDKLRCLNKQLLNIYKDDINNLEKQRLISKILQDDKFMFKIDIETAYAILSDLTIDEEDLRSVYSELIDIKNYEEN